MTSQIFNQFARHLAATVNNHVDPDLGMTNVMLQALAKEMMPFFARCRLLRHAGDREYRGREDHGEHLRFLGVYDDDDLPAVVADLADAEKHNTLIINLGSGVYPSGHFVTVHLTGSAIYYIDSFGKPPPTCTVSHQEDRGRKSNKRSNLKIKIKEKPPCFLARFLHLVAQKKLGRANGLAETEIVFNDEKIQPLNSVACGLYALLFCVCIERGEDPFKLTWWLEQDKLDLNDKLCQTYLNHFVQECVDHVYYHPKNSAEE